MSSRQFPQAVLLTLGTLVSGAVTHADPLRVTSGEVTNYWDCRPGGSASLRGDGLALDAGGIGCGTATFDGQFVLDPFSAFERTVTVNGATYEARLVGTLLFDAQPFEIPAGQGSPEPFSYYLEVPMSMTGRIQGYGVDALGQPNSLLFDVRVFGTGSASGFLDIISGSGVVRPPTVIYGFSEADPVPEPATFLLIGAGLAGVAARRRARAHRRGSSMR